MKKFYFALLFILAFSINAFCQEPNQLNQLDQQNKENLQTLNTPAIPATTPNQLIVSASQVLQVSQDKPLFFIPIQRTPMKLNYEDLPEVLIIIHADEKHGTNEVKFTRKQIWRFLQYFDALTEHIERAWTQD